MKKLSILLAIICLTIGQFSFACDCNSQDEFKKAAPQSEFVALVKVTKYLTYKNIYGVETPISMELEIIETYKGKEKKRKITVWGGDVNICRPMLNKFKKDQYYVVALDKVVENSNGISHPGEKSSDYFIAQCGERWLNADVKSGTVTNWITEEVKTVSLKEIKAIFLKD
ncbi:hypothetical protein [uncultured Flavobacterium sp.]|uniref:hypothetical protein n=1 Tax=uncultured Flavobacterium sp. TaxID=165435 RepID=UPI0030ED7542